MGLLIFLGVIAVIVLAVVARGVRTVPQGYEWTVERFGRYRITLSPGLRLINPFTDAVGHKINVQETVLEIPPQNVITKDNAVVVVDGIVFYQVFDPSRAAYEVPRPRTGGQQHHDDQYPHRDRRPRPRRDAVETRRDQRAAAAGARRRDRTVGDQDHPRRAEGRAPAGRRAGIDGEAARPPIASGGRRSCAPKASSRRRSWRRRAPRRRRSSTRKGSSKRRGARRRRASVSPRPRHGPPPSYRRRSPMATCGRSTISSRRNTSRR